MHPLAAAYQSAATTSLMLSCFFPASSIRFSLPVTGAKSGPACGSTRFKVHVARCPSVKSFEPFRRSTEIPFLSTLLVSKSKSSLGTPSRSKGTDVSARRRVNIRSLASRKDRQDVDNEGESPKFEPDMASLRTGFSKKFRDEDRSGAVYDWNLDDEDGEDGDVQVRSFRGGDTGKTEGRHISRTAKNSESSGSRRSRDVGRSDDGRRTSQSDSRQGARPNDGKSRSGVSEAPYKRLNRSGGAGGGTSGRPWSAQGEVDGGTHPGKRFQNDDKIVGNRRSGGFRTANTASKYVRRSREAYGGGEWSKDTPTFEDEGRKKKPVIEPVNFTTAMSRSPHVAIIGGGMSGLVCALTLEEHGIQSTVFDTGKHGLGGRMGTRSLEVQDGLRLVFDHAAQFFTVEDPRFQKLVDRWISEGAVTEWSGNVGKLQDGGQYSELPTATRYIGTNGMRSLADHMLSQSRKISVRRPCWISTMEAENGVWKLMENRKLQGEFDIVVIAHNGKCANRLLSSAHVPLVARQMKKLDLSSIWALLAAFKEPLPLPADKSLDAAFVEGIDSISWMGNNSNKFGLTSDRSPHCWTFFSTAAYGKTNKVPQESIPSAKAHRVRQDMLHGVESALGLSKDSLPPPIFTRLQLWGAALPTNTPNVPCIFDAQSRVGICGDWLVGSNLEAAALSGMALADHISKYRDHGHQDVEDFNVGLKESLTAVMGHDIGQFNGTEKLVSQSHREALSLS